jgi:hypothetical protein
MNVADDVERAVGEFRDAACRQYAGPFMHERLYQESTSRRRKATRFR